MLALIATLTVLSAPMLAVVHGLSHQREAAHERASGAARPHQRAAVATQACAEAILAQTLPAEAGALDDDPHPHPVVQAPYASRQTLDVRAAVAALSTPVLMTVSAREARHGMSLLARQWPPPAPSDHSRPRAPPLA